MKLHTCIKSLSLLGFTLFIMSCRKDKTIEFVPADRNTAEQQIVYTMDMLNRTMYILTQSVKKAVDSTWTLPFSCAQLSVTYYGFPRYTIYFDNGCTEEDGSVYSGSMKFDLYSIVPGEYEVENVWTQALKINGVAVSASIGCSYSPNSDTSFSGLGFEFNLLTKDSTYIGMSGNLNFLWINHEDADPANDEFQFSLLPASVGGYTDSTSYHLQSSEPLIFIASCQFPASGIVSFEPFTGSTSSLNFSSGCSDRFSVTLNGITQVEEIPQL